VAGALPHGSCSGVSMSAGEVLRPREIHYSTTNCLNFHEWETASPQILLAGFIRVHSDYSWFKDIRAG